MSYNINLGGWGSVFAVPSKVVDSGLKLASETQLKVLLYILRNSAVQLTDESVGQSLSIDPADVRDAVDYWIDRGLLAKIDNELIQPQSSLPEQHDTPVQSTTSAPSAPDTTEKAGAKPRALSRAVRPEPAYVAKRLRSDPEVVTLMDEAQQILSKVLSNADAATLIMLHDTDGLPVEVILMLMNYCAGIGKGNLRYIERLGIKWASEGITTPQLVEEKIKSISDSTDAFRKITAVFGLHTVGSPTKKQLELSDCWINTWQFCDEMLRLAYERCIDIKGELNMQYINGILRRWHEKGYVTPDDVYSDKKPASASANSKIKAVKGSSNVASYDLDEYEKKSIFDD